MYKARTLLLVLVGLLLPAPAADLPVADEPSLQPAAVEAAPSAALASVGYRYEPWHADYPASTEFPGAQVFAENQTQVATARHALSLFEEAGLELPSVEIWMHADVMGCAGSSGRGKAGLYMVRNGIHVVLQCGSLFTLLHELAHVWDNHLLTDSTRSEFLAMRQADSWSNPGKWERAGGEHLADVIAWGLHPDHPRPSRTKPNDNLGLVTAFCVATGHHPLDDGRLQTLAQRHCDPTEER